MVILLFNYAVNFNIFNELCFNLNKQLKVIYWLKLCRNVRIELTDFFNSHSKFSLIVFAVFLSGCKHTNYF